MKKSRLLIAHLVIQLFLCAPVLLLAQTSTTQSKRFTKEGVSFDYPEKWAVADQSNAQMQQLVMTQDGADAQISVLVVREKMDAKKSDETRKGMTDKFLQGWTREFEQDGARVERSQVKAAIGGGEVEGTRLRASLGGVPGNVEVYSLVLGNRVVLLSLLRPDTDAAKAAVAWDMLRASLKIEEAPKSP